MKTNIQRKTEVELQTLKKDIQKYAETAKDKLHSYRKDMRAIIDWLQFTLPRPSEISPELRDDQLFWVFDILGLPAELFKICKTGMNGYSKRMRWENISILWDGAPDMGIHVVMTGSGCRAYEMYQLMRMDKGEIEHHSVWTSLFELILAVSSKFTRIDLSVDDFKTYFPLKDIVNKLDDGLCSSLFETYKVIRSGKISDGGLKGLTIYLGSATSDMQIVAYDKYLERKSKGKELTEDISAWNRWGCRFYDGHAYQAVMKLVQGQTMGKLIHSTIHRYFNILQPVKGDTNRGRWPLWNKWARFLGAVEKAEFNFIKPEKKLDDTLRYLKEKLPKVLAKAHAYDEALIEEAIAEGIGKLNEKELYEIEQAQKLRDFNTLRFIYNSGADPDDDDSQVRSEFTRQQHSKKNRTIQENDSTEKSIIG